MRRNKLINLICGMTVGVFLMLAVVGVLILSGVMSLQKIALTFSTESVEALYDGTPLTNHSWNLTDGELKRGHELKVTFKSSQTDVGETDNMIEVRVIDELGADVTGDYVIDYKFGKIKVNPRNITIETASDSKEYDGLPLQNKSFEVLNMGDGLVKGHRADMHMPIFITEPGTVHNTPINVRILNEVGNDVTRNYNIIVREGTLTVIGKGSGGGGGNASGEGGGAGDEDMEFSGSSSLVAGEDMQDVVLFSVNSETTENLYLKMESYGDYTGKDWLAAQPYRERSQIGYNSYDKMAFLMSTTLEASGQTPKSVQIKSHCGIFAVPYYALPEVSDFIAREQTDVKFTGSTGGIYSIVRVPYTDNVKADKSMSHLEREYRDFVYGQYLDIDDESNAFMQTLIFNNFFDASDPQIIEKVARYIQGAAKYNLKYDRALDEESNIAVAFLERYGEGVCRHYASAATLLYRALGIPARYTVGVFAQAQAGQWVDVTSMNAHAWVEVYIDGIGWRQVEVTGGSGGYGNGGGGDVEDVKTADLTPKTVRKQYDGTPLYAENVVTGLEAYEALGYTYKAIVTGERTEAGKSYSTLDEIAIFDKNGRDVTAEFTLTRNNGTIQVFYDVVYCYTEDYEKEYDGEVYETEINIKTKLSDSDYSFETECTTPTSAGKHVNSFTLKITENKSGRDVTDEYWIVKDYGTATIHRSYLLIEAASAEKVYDGTPLTAEDYSIVKRVLAKGDKIDMCIFSGSQTEIGRSENAITYLLIMNEKGENVTSNYFIELISGTLKVRMK